MKYEIKNIDDKPVQVYTGTKKVGVLLPGETGTFISEKGGGIRSYIYFSIGLALGFLLGMGTNL